MTMAKQGVYSGSGEVAKSMGWGVAAGAGAVGSISGTVDRKDGSFGEVGGRFRIEGARARLRLYHCGCLRLVSHDGPGTL